VLKNPNRKNDEDRVPDVAADSPEGTMERFAAGLRRVLSVPKTATPKKKRRRQTHA